MKYEIEFKPKAIKDLKTLLKPTQAKVLAKIQAMENDLHGTEMLKS